MDYKKLKEQINLEGNDKGKDKLRWDMKARCDKLDDLKVKYPELVRALDIARQYLGIQNVWAEDVEVDKHFEELEKLLMNKEE